MGFISFSLDFYQKELKKLETAAVSEQTVYRAKQLLKMLDDLADEGYTELNEKLEEACQGVSKLRAYLTDNHARPFPVDRRPLAKAGVAYGQQTYALTEAIRELIRAAEASPEAGGDGFLTKLMDFCDWVGYEDDTAYIFLLRDTLVPYIYYQCKGRKSIHPWLLGRNTLAALTGESNIDDKMRASIIRALEVEKCRNYEDFCGAVLPDIRSTLKQYPEIESNLAPLLAKIPEKHIIAVESGCSGTFPMLLMSLDSRVELRMYTTYPYLLEIYGDRIYSPKYEENRLFETLYSQDLYFQFSGLRDGCFFVRKCENTEVERRAFAEIKTVLNGRNSACSP